MKSILKKSEFTFDDILLMPGLSDFLPEDEEKNITLSSKLTNKISLSLPIVSSPMPGISEDKMAIALAKAGGIGFIHAFQEKNKQLSQVKSVKRENLLVGASVMDINEKGHQQVKKLLKVGADIISIETGHALNSQTLDFIKKCKDTYKEKIQISAALVVNKEGTKAVIKAGADNVRVGIGGGSHCTTRVVTGFGRPQLSAVEECYKAARKHKIPIMSDTGIRSSGDILKAIAFGAESVMIGGMFAGSSECPGEVVKRDGKLKKLTWGMCTRTAIEKKQKYSFNLLDILQGNFFEKENDLQFEEGVERLVDYKGETSKIIQSLKEGMLRGMWYAGTKNISNFQKNVKVIKVSKNTYQENIPRI